MGFLSDIWNGILEGLESILRQYEGLLEPIAGGYAWGLSIILLTVTVRIFLIPLMVRQTKSMRAMQHLQPEIKRIQEKYKADRSMAKTDPERYKKLKEKQREAQMALYQEHSVNPVGGCLPLLLQMPIFLALFRVLQDGRVEELAAAPFFGVNSLSDTAAGSFEIGAVVLVVLQVATTFYSQKQMQARNVSASGDQAQAQKIMMYIMPAFLGYLSFTFPIGVVLYWVTTNFWTIGQQYFIFRKVEAEEAKAEADRKTARKSGPSKSPKAGSSKAGSSKAGSSKAGSPKAGSPKAGSPKKDVAANGSTDQSAEIVDSGESPRKNGNGSTPSKNGQSRERTRGSGNQPRGSRNRNRGASDAGRESNKARTKRDGS
ncbi:MAG: membrane protein insertase YidC [Euzebya sp.]